MLSVGTEAPGFNVKDHNNNSVSLKDYRGKVVVLWFYPKADTPGCTQEGKGFRDLYKEFEGKNVVVLGVSLDTVEENKAFADKFKFPYPLLCDVDREIAKSYCAISGPNDDYASRITYVIDNLGVIIEAIEEVNTATHAKDICSLI
tara:strand:+ start:1212 stop:1649 length:438 start_codon:yes stop_codon:yes gene_type:complete